MIIIQHHAALLKNIPKLCRHFHKRWYPIRLPLLCFKSGMGNLFSIFKIFHWYSESLVETARGICTEPLGNCSCPSKEWLIYQCVYMYWDIQKLGYEKSVHVQWFLGGIAANSVDQKDLIYLLYSVSIKHILIW